MLYILNIASSIRLLGRRQSGKFWIKFQRLQDNFQRTFQKFNRSGEKLEIPLTSNCLCCHS